MRIKIIFYYFQKTKNVKKNFLKIFLERENVMKENKDRDYDEKE